MKKCPFCAEEVQDEALKCRFCGEFFNPEDAQKSKVKWYNKTSSIVISFLFVGPFMLPLVWFNPKYSRIKKTVVTLVILFITWLLAKATMRSFDYLTEYYPLLRGV